MSETSVPTHAATQTTTGVESKMSNEVFGASAERLAHAVVAAQPVSKMMFTPQGLEISFVSMPEALRDKIAVAGVQFPDVPSDRALAQYRGLNEAGLTMGQAEMAALAQKLKDTQLSTPAAATAERESAAGLGHAGITTTETPAAAPTPELLAAAEVARNTPAQQAVVGEHTARLAAASQGQTVRTL